MMFSMFKRRISTPPTQTSAEGDPQASGDDAVVNSGPVHDFNSLPEKVRFALSMPISYFEAMRQDRVDSDSVPSLTNIAFVLDKSESMAKSKEATICGFNQQIRIVREGARDAGETTFTEVHFNSTVKMVNVWSDLDELVPLTHQTYILDGETALYDALGEAINTLLGTPRIFSPKTGTLVILFTDGRENASLQYTANVLGELVKRLEASGHWTFALVGPTGSVTPLGSLLSIRPTNVAEYDPISPLGTEEAFKLSTRASTTFMNSRVMGVTQVDDLFPQTDIADLQSHKPRPVIPREPSEGDEPASWITANTLTETESSTVLLDETEQSFAEAELRKRKIELCLSEGFATPVSILRQRSAAAAFEDELCHDVEEVLATDLIWPRKSSTGIVYKNTYANGKIYVGIETPWERRLRYLQGDRPQPRRFDNYKTRDILWESETASFDELLQVQRECIARLHSENPELGYNYSLKTDQFGK